MSSLVLSAPNRFRARAGLAIGLSLWFLAMLAAGFAGVFSRGDPSRPPVPLGAVALLPVVVFLVALATSSAVRGFVRSLDLRILTFAQTGRVIGGVFVVLWAVGRLPAGFALPAGLGDLFVGVTAPLVASYVVPRLPARRGLYVAWVAFGILDLVVAVTSGVLHSPTSVGLLAGPVTTAPMGSLPLSLIPTFLVPLAVILHVAALHIVLARPADADAARS
jgi:hypothetical protein